MKNGRVRFGSQWLLAGALFFLLAPKGLPQTAQSAAVSERQQSKLQLGAPVKRELGPGLTDVFTVELTAGQFAHVVGRQKGVDVVLTVAGPDEKVLVTADSLNGAFGPEPASWIAKDSGVYQVRVSKAKRTSEAGQYDIELTDLREPTQADLSRIAAETSFFAAVAEEQAGDKEKSLEAINGFERAASLWRGLKDGYEEALCLHRIGAAYAALGEKQKALDYYGQALPLRRTVGDRAGEADTLNNIGIVHSDLGQKQKALDYYGQALPLVRAVGDRADEAWTLSNIGAAHSDLGEKQKALDYYGRALPRFRAVGDRAGEAWTLNGSGTVCSDLGEKQKALEYYSEALELFRAVGDRSGEAATLNKIGEVHAGLGEKQKALQYYWQALSFLRAVGDPSGKAWTLNNIGIVYSELGEEQRALDSYRQALRLFRATGNRPGEAWTLTSIGAAYSDAREKRRALEYYEQALPLFRAVGDRSGEAYTLDKIGVVYSDLREKQKALDYYGRALPLDRSVGNRAGEAETLGNISSAFRDLARPDTAIWFGKQAVNVLQSIRRDNQNLPDELRRSYATSVESKYRDLAALLVERERFGEAEEVLNLLKDKEASDFIRRDAVADQLRPATLLESERKALNHYEQIVGQMVSLGQQKAALVDKRTKGPLSATESEQAVRLDADLAATNRVLLRFLQEQEKDFSPTSAVTKRVGAFRDEAAGVQKALRQMGPDVVAIYTLVMPDKYIAMLVTSGARKAYTTAIKEKDLNQKIFTFRQLLQNPASHPKAQAQELYRIVFPEGLRRDLDGLNAKTIMWSIDSTLRYVPFAALHDGDDYLVKRFRNSLITPASLTRLTETSASVWEGTGFGVSEAKANFEALPSVAAELHGIFRQNEMETAPIAGAIRLNAAFTRSSFENDLRAKKNSVVHIATHFDSEPGVTANSHLLLGDGSELSLADIEDQQDLFDGVELLTLSACSTAFTNKSEDGREVDSFGTIAQRLGAKGVVASLWSVNDEATARLMETMYRLRQRNPGAGKSEALRLAQEQMASGALRPDEQERETAKSKDVVKDWSHPFYWAPFILIGNWN